jgi:hypothetical protein
MLVVRRFRLVLASCTLATTALVLASVTRSNAMDAPPAPGAPSPPPAAPPPPSAPGPAGPAVPAVPAPRASFDREEHDFGVTRQEQDLHTEFRLTNAGTATLTLLDLHADCGCAAGTASAKEIAPGATITIAGTLRTMRAAGVVTKRLIVTTNDPVRPRVELKMRIDVALGIVLAPARLYFGDVAAGTTPSTSMRVQWRDGVGTPFRVTAVESPGVAMTFATKEFHTPPWQGYEVTATFQTPPPVGTVSAMAIVRTDDADAASARISVPIQAFVSGKVWLDRRAVSLGIVPFGKGRPIAVICRPFGAGVDLGEVTATSRKGRVECKAIRSGKEWVVTITLPETSPSGRVEDVVEVKSSIAGEPPAEVVVTGTVMEPLK